MIDERDRDKMARLLNMRSSAFDGETASALRRASAIADKYGGWAAVLSGGATARELEISTQACRELLARLDRLEDELARVRAAQRPAHWTQPITTAEKIDVCARWANVCTGWEREFVVSLAGRWRPLSPKQQQRLDELVGKIERIARLQRALGGAV
jgi:hypothetical protein